MIESNGMNFILSPEIIDDIIFAMENQNAFFFFDAVEGICVDEDTAAHDYEKDIEAERYYSLPEWTPAQGFRVMEQFTVQVHNPLLRQELREALRQRKGVFRKYKVVLKTVPAIEREWYRFKTQQMRAAVYEWYNELRMIWGLEKISFEEETEPQLLLQDFTFSFQNAAVFGSDFLQDFIRKTAVSTYIEEALPPSVAEAAFNVLASLAHTMLPSEKALTGATIIAAHVENGPCAICLLTDFPQQHCLCIPFLRTLPDYRGLGLGKELLRRAFAYAEQTESNTLFFADLCIPPYFITQLERDGFQRIGLMYGKHIDREPAILRGSL